MSTKANDIISDQERELLEEKQGYITKQADPVFDQLCDEKC